MKAPSPHPPSPRSSRRASRSPRARPRPRSPRARRRRSKTRFVVGLGNPGERYRRTRHNVGFMVVDALLDRAGAKNGRETGDAWIATGHLGGEEVLFLKPLTFMNRSGAAVERLLSEQNGTPGDLIVAVDDVALPLDTLRIRERGSHGGHNGLRSLIEVLGTDEFVRVRLGIGVAEPPLDLAEFVLSSFHTEEVLIVQEMVGRAADAVTFVIEAGAPAAMSRWNGPKQA